jgi:AmmeMemoRadiSam system protein A
MLSAAGRTALRRVARDSIRHGLLHGRVLTVNPADYAATLQQPAASFVTLEILGELRGCIGTLEAHRALVIDVAANAFAAAFRDSRFPPLTPHEESRLDIHISVLSKPEPVHVRSEAELLGVLRPGIDGVVLSEGARRGTFLPSVWEQLPDPRDFLAHLKRKAGLPANYWSDTLRIERYTCEVF